MKLLVQEGSFHNILKPNMTHEQVVEYLYRHHYKFIFFAAYNICERWDLAEDTTHDGFIRLATSPTRFADWVPARAYLYNCVKYATFERLGKDRRRQAAIRDFIRNSETSVKTRTGAEVLAALSKLRSLASRHILEEIYLQGKLRRHIAREKHVDKGEITRLERKALAEMKLLLVS